MNIVCVIGGGPAGMMAAYASASRGNRVILVEKNEKLGKKLYLTGKGRCNITNTARKEDFFSHVKRNPKFLYSAFHALDNAGLMRFLEEQGVPLREERGGRVFPASGKSSDVIRALSRVLEKADVQVRLRTAAQALLIDGGAVTGVRTDGGIVPCGSAVVATGGLSYPLTGSTGDGYFFAQHAGHTLAQRCPSLVPLQTAGDPQELAGLTLKNVALRVQQNGKTAYEGFGEMLFTHTGISGPLTLSASACLDLQRKDAFNDVRAMIDLKPALDERTLDKRLLRDFEQNKNRDARNALRALLPLRLIPAVLRCCGVDPMKKIHSVTAAERAALIRAVKAFELRVVAARPIGEAIVTRGGVRTGEIDPSTMQSRLVRGLFFAGEVLDVDAETGGYNLQTAFSTGYLAGLHA